MLWQAFFVPPHSQCGGFFVASTVVLWRRRRPALINDPCIEEARLDGHWANSVPSSADEIWTCTL